MPGGDFWAFGVHRIGASVLVLIAAGSGCAPVVLTQLQRERFQEAQALADRTTTVYRVPPVRVTRSFWLRTVYQAHASAIAVDPRVFDGGDWPLIMAHELGHVTLGHREQESRDRQMVQQMELDANSRAIEILVRVLGWSEQEAVRRFAGYLVDANDRIRAGTRRLSRAHLSPCNELDDLLKRFPSVSDVPMCRRW